MGKELRIIEDLDANATFELIAGEYNCLIINLDEEKSFLDCLKDKNQFIEDMNFDIEFQGKEYEKDEEREKVWQYFYDNFDDILNKVDYISLFINEDLKEFINKYPILKTKKLVWKESISISDFDKIDYLMKECKDYKDFYVNLQGNSGYVKLDECKKIMNEIKKYVDHIKKLNLSPLESILYAYDMVRDRVYKKENTDDYSLSRDLKNVLFGNEIVCVGYSRILSCIFDNLGIDNNLIYLSSKDNSSGHLRNAVYVDDQKYGVSGYYYLDATWDSKRQENDNYLLAYRCFLKTRDEMEELEEHQFIYEDSKDYSKDLKVKLEQIYIEENQIEFVRFIFLLNVLYKKAFHTKKELFKIETCMRNIDHFKNIYDLDYLYEKIDEIHDNFNKSISAETYIKLVNNVRKIEHDINPEKYQYSITTIYCICVNSKWKFKEHHYSEEEKLLAAIFNEKLKKHSFEEDFKNFINFDLEKPMNPEQITSTKTLSKILEKKEYIDQ